MWLTIFAVALAGAICLTVTAFINAASQVVCCFRACTG